MLRNLAVTMGFPQLTCVKCAPCVMESGSVHSVRGRARRSPPFQIVKEKNAIRQMLEMVALYGDLRDRHDRTRPTAKSAAKSAARSTRDVAKRIQTAGI